MKKRTHIASAFFENGRGERIRTSDLTVPNRALYQAEPRPDKSITKSRLRSDLSQFAGASSFFPNRCFANSIIGGSRERKTTTITTFSI